jgi:hypothetical protein
MVRGLFKANPKFIILFSRKVLLFYARLSQALTLKAAVAPSFRASATFFGAVMAPA